MSFQLLTLLTCAAGMALVGLVYNAIVVQFMVGALLAVALVSYTTSRLSASALEWRRQTADRVFEHEPLTIATELTNRGRFPRFLLTVIDSLPEFLRPDHVPEFVLPALWPGERVRLSYQARGLKRGVYPLGPLRVSVSDPFGIFQRFVRLPAMGEAVVYPRPVPLNPGEMAETASGVGISTGERAHASDSGLDFYGIRDYQPGDELRRIHWPATAHHNQLTVIEFERGASRSLAVLLDTRAGTEFGVGADTTLEVGVRVAASLVRWTLQSQGHSILACDSAGGFHWLELERSDQEYEALELLARVQADGVMPISEALELAGRRLLPGAAVCVVTAAPDPALSGVVALLRELRIQVAAVLLDAISFDPRAPRPTMAAALEAAGARTASIRRGEDLQEALRGALLASD
jgi:uncharacterized protein (DUF58 family)